MNARKKTLPRPRYAYLIMPVGRNGKPKYQRGDGGEWKYSRRIAEKWVSWAHPISMCIVRVRIDQEMPQ